MLLDIEGQPVKPLEPVLIDFGFSKPLGYFPLALEVPDIGSVSSVQTQSSDNCSVELKHAEEKPLRNLVPEEYFVCTCLYRAPELFGLFKKRNYGEKVDEWSIGCILYELFTGQVPFYSERDSPNEVKAKVASYVWHFSGKKPCCSQEKPLNVESVLRGYFEKQLEIPKNKNMDPSTIKQCRQLFQFFVSVVFKLLHPLPTKRCLAADVLSVCYGEDVSRSDTLSPVPHPGNLSTTSNFKINSSQIATPSLEDVNWIVKEYWTIFEKAQEEPSPRLFYQSLDKWKACLRK